VTTCGRKINLSQVFAGQTVGINKPTTTYGSSASWKTIWDISTMRPAGSNPFKTLSGRRRYLRRRYEM
jgi:hypothetical protein